MHDCVQIDVNNRKDVTFSTNLLAFLSALSFARVSISASCNLISAIVAKHVISGPFLFHNNDGEHRGSFRLFPLAFGAASSYIFTNGALSRPGASTSCSSCREDLYDTGIIGGVYECIVCV